MAETKKDILWRVYLVYGFMCLFALAIFIQVCRIKFIEGEYWIAKADSSMLKMDTILPIRGNIFSSDGKLLASSTPIYDIRIDTKSDAFKASDFNSKLDSLSEGIASILGDKSVAEYKHILKETKRRGDRYFLLQRDISHKQLIAIQKLPVFNKGKYSGGLIVEAKSVRERLFKELAKRTIGFDREHAKPVGIEGAFDSILTGVSGQRIMQKVAGGVWKPINDENQIEAMDGNDVVSTINLDLQDVATSALYKQLNNNNAARGCVVLMEVATGHVKAIANLKRGKDGVYYEEHNDAIGYGSEPGSTFKLASLMVAIEDGYITTKNVVDIEGGEKFYNGIRIADHDKGKYDKLSVQQIFEKSSNVGVSKIVYQYYSKDPQKFIDRINSFGLNKKIGLQLIGEAEPLIKNPKSKTWSGATLPVMSYGYETKLTPLQTLTFYNAVANNGRMVKPIFVQEIRKQGKLIHTYETEVVNAKICSDATLKQAREMMEGVVLRGTATNLKFDTYTIAGKTGTAKMAFGKSGYSLSDSVRYQSSFCGYFPADKPLYSCIVVMYDLSPKFYYGNVAAGPVFKEIADKVYSTSIAMHNEIKTDSLINKKQPEYKGGDITALNKVLQSVNKKPVENKNKFYASVSNNTSGVSVNLFNGLVPDVAGMPMRDAIYILESTGMYVTPVGKGVVKKQSVQAGTPIVKGKKIIIELS